LSELLRLAAAYGRHVDRARIPGTNAEWSRGACAWDSRSIHSAKRCQAQQPQRPLHPSVLGDWVFAGVRPSKNRTGAGDIRL